MKCTKLAAIALLVIAIGGCLARQPTPAAPTIVPTASATLAPSATSTTAPTSVPPSTTTPQPISAQQPFSAALQIRQAAGNVRTEAIGGLLYLPADYGRDAQRRWPLIVFLHGSGERGYDPQRLTAIGLPQILQSRADCLIYPWTQSCLYLPISRGIAF